MVTPVMSQGQDGEADIFVITDALSSAFSISHGHWIEISKEEIRDCCGHCGRDEPGLNYECLSKLPLCTKQQYPSDLKCVCSSDVCSNSPYHIKGGKMVQRGNETDLAYAVLINPVVVSVDANRTSFMVSIAVNLL